MTKHRKTSNKAGVTNVVGISKGLELSHRVDDTAAVLLERADNDVAWDEAGVVDLDCGHEAVEAQRLGVLHVAAHLQLAHRVEHVAVVLLQHGRDVRLAHLLLQLLQHHQHHVLQTALLHALFCNTCCCHRAHCSRRLRPSTTTNNQQPTTNTTKTQPFVFSTTG